MRIIFFGTPEYVVPILETIHGNFKTKFGESPFVGVVTMPPMPVGRKQMLTYSPVDDWAHAKKLPILFDPQEIVTQDLEADFGICAAYGKIIPDSVIAHFPMGIINIHPSMLPKYRGASPIQSAIAMGESQIGVSFLLMDSQMDHGDIISQFKEDIYPEDTNETLRARAFKRSADVLVSLVPAYLSEKVNIKSQDHEAATFTTTIKKEHGLIPPKILSAVLEGRVGAEPWEIPFVTGGRITPDATHVEAFVRALTPWPGAWTQIKFDKNAESKRLKIIKVHLSDSVNPSLILDEVQLEGKNPTPWKQLSGAHTGLIFG